MNEKDILLLLTHGALCGLGAKATLISSLEMAKQSVDLARFTLGELKAAGYTFEAADATETAAPVPTTVVATPVANAGIGYDASIAPAPNQALEVAVTIRDSGNAIESSAMSPVVQQFQQAAGLKADGIAGPKTQAAYRYWLAVAASQK